MRGELDVAVLGGGLAGNLLARQLRRRLPGLRIALFERSPTRSYKVGESTVEIASHYLVRRQGLSRYLYEQHLPKNGIRCSRARRMAESIPSTPRTPKPPGISRPW